MQEKTKSKNDLGVDPVCKLFIRLAIPAISAQVINALYNIIDRIYIGRIENVGAEALTGVGLVFPIIIIITSFSALVGMGGAPLVAIKLGQQKKDEAENILGNCFALLIIIPIILTPLFAIFGREMLMLFGASENTIDYANNYMQIYILGTIFVQMSLGLNPFITTQGRARTAMFTVLIGAVLNIILDPIFIFTLNLGVRGAAIATIISQTISAAWAVCFLFSRRSAIIIKPKYFKISKQIILAVISLGVSPFVMKITESMLNIALNSSLQKYGGDLAVGSMTICSSIMMFTMLVMTGFSQASQPIVGYNYGAKNMERVKQSFRYLITCTIITTLIVWLVAIFCPQIFASLFTDDEELIAKTSWALRIFLFGIFAFGIQMPCQTTFVALGKARISLLLALLRKVILLIPLIYILPLFFEDKVFAIFLAEPIADILATSITGVTFIICFNRILKKNMINS